MSDAKHRIETTVFYMAKEYKFKAEELESQITTLTQKGITELSVTDEKVSRDKNKLLRLMKLVAQHAPEVYVSFLAEAAVIDREVIAAASNLFCSFSSSFMVSSRAMLFSSIVLFIFEDFISVTNLL